jgi:hypothetical protein
MSEREQETTQEESQRTDPAAQEQQRTDGGSQSSEEDFGSSSDRVSASAQEDEGEGEPSRSQTTTASEPRGEEQAPLFPNDEAERFRRRWEDLQAGFVDRPREMVEEADDLVGELMQQLTTGFDNERSSLEAQWEKGEDVSTEELRVALTRYRSFFNRLLSA